MARNGNKVSISRSQSFRLAQLQKDVEQLQKELTLKDEKLQLQEANLKESYTRASAQKRFVFLTKRRGN